MSAALPGLGTRAAGRAFVRGRRRPLDRFRAARAQPALHFALPAGSSRSAEPLELHA